MKKTLQITKKQEDIRIFNLQGILASSATVTQCDQLSKGLVY